MTQTSPEENTQTNNRYAQDWNSYSQTWDTLYGDRYSFLGEEWHDDGAERKSEQLYFSLYAERFLRPDMTVLEVGPGGGKWTVRIASKVKKLIVLDVAEEMLKRTKQRCDSLGLTNVEYILADGKGFQPVADASIDFFFSYDVFVHIAVEDSWPYTQEMCRVLAPGGIGACHYTINSVPESWNFIQQHNDWYRFNQHTLGQHYYFTPESLRRMFEQSGLVITEQHLMGYYCTCIFYKPSENVIPKLEQLLAHLISDQANDDPYRTSVVSQIHGLCRELEQKLIALLVQAQAEKDVYKRKAYAAEIRRLWRGLSK